MRTTYSSSKTGTFRDMPRSIITKEIAPVINTSDAKQKKVFEYYNSMSREEVRSAATQIPDHVKNILLNSL
jgi:hypothetical protein